ncbi:hypothetical protein HBF26_14350 [Luteibacter jiangsuensis]|uniref:Uncharacterized protein n=1 Tax=Luteibacter jiangsuensis TaxID=637577 RepID=A0ABX0Q8L2_9GAMM|nr:hypothetical protein [Luteibacter jiangsuensis]NID06076.1 hypothetical protein [Luteibacter jiangsuensis]
MADTAAPSGDRISKVAFDWLKEVVVAIGILSFAREFFGCGRTLGYLKQDVTNLALTAGPLLWVGIATYIAGTTLTRRFAPPGSSLKSTAKGISVLVVFVLLSTAASVLVIAALTPAGTMDTHIEAIDNLFNAISATTPGKLKCDA